LEALLEQVIKSGDSLAKSYALQIQGDYLKPAWVLGKVYDAVVANPPYMGGKGMNAELKAFAQKAFPDSKSDLFAMFMERGFSLLTDTGFNAQVTMQSWMFLSSYQSMREKLISQSTLDCMVHMGNGVMGIAFGTAATVFRKTYIESFTGNFSYCENDDLNEQNVPKEFPVKNERLKQAKQDDFKKIPASPIAYWVSHQLLKVLNWIKFLVLAETRLGMATADNNRFLKLWQEINSPKVALIHVHA
jgi:type I restriction-modification system DNA methylase subunit